MRRRETPNAQPPPPTRVEISAAGHQVVIEAVGPVDTIARKALDLWRKTDNPAAARSADVVGFTATDPFSSPLMPPEVALPHRVTTSEGADEHRRTRR